MSPSREPAPEQSEPLQVTREVGEKVRDGVVRSFSDPAATTVTARSPRGAIERYLSDRASGLKTESVDLRETEASAGKATLRIRYQQYVNDLPLLGAGVQATADVQRAGVLRAENSVDLDVDGAPSPDEAMDTDELHEAALAPFAADHSGAEVTRDELAYLRHDRRPEPAEHQRVSPQLLATGTEPDGQVHLVRDLRIETYDPAFVFRVVIDAVTGDLLSIELLTRQVAATLRVFSPDPVSESDDGTLRGSSSAATLNPFRHTVTAEVAPATNSTFVLTGDWVRCRDFDPPSFAQPSETGASFEYETYPANRRFLSANAYYWLDALARYLRSFGNTTLNTNMVRVDVDAQAFNGQDQSDWNPTTPPQIRFG
jgi:hypothetical protein